MKTLMSQENDGDEVADFLDEPELQIDGDEMNDPQTQPVAPTPLKPTSPQWLTNGTWTICSYRGNDDLHCYCYWKCIRRFGFPISCHWDDECLWQLDLLCVGL
jgi:hypothetical protein